MTKKTFISTFLLLVYSFILIHNVIPHHHHADTSEVNNHDYHNHHNHSHDHHHHNDDAEPDGLFFHLTHCDAPNEILFCNNNHHFQKKQSVKLFVVSTSFVQSDIKFKVVTKRKSINFYPEIPVQSFCAANALRGPPFFS